MVTTDIIREIIFDFQERQLPAMTRRSFDFTCPPNKIRVIIGARRVGKTYSFYQLIEDLFQQGIPKDQILFINFEDERLIPLEVTDLTKILNSYFEIFPANKERGVYLFFDEIQNVPQWELFIRRVHETEKMQINLTGSSSKLMSQEIATQLRGRTLTFEIFPFSFTEYLKHKNIASEKLSSKNKSFVINAFNSYFYSGGYPEILNVGESLRVKILQDYFNLLLYKDLVERHDIRNYGLIKYLVKYLLANNANAITVNKIFGDLKSQGFQLSKDTLHNYLSYLEDALCLSQVPIFAESIRKQQINYRKIYFVDHGLVTSLVRSRSYDMGRLLETLVYNQLRRQFHRDQLFYYKTTDSQEVDFLIQDRGKVISLLQVCESLEDIKTKEREVETLFQAMAEVEISTATIITRNDSDKIEFEDKLVEVMPFWQWALGETKAQ